jgi:hypothetical protein
MQRHRRTPWILAILLATTTLSVAATGAWLLADPPAPPAAKAPPVAPAPAAAPRGSIHFVSDPPWEALRARMGQDVLVLDLEGLESLDAAVALAEHWRNRHGSAPELDCWLRKTTAEAELQAASALAGAGCTRVHIAR